jgi:hypothetical protein
MIFQQYSGTGPDPAVGLVGRGHNRSFYNLYRDYFPPAVAGPLKNIAAF